MTPQDIHTATDLLSRTTIGREALRTLLRWLDESALSLDSDNQAACLTLIDAAWGAYAGTTRDVMREALEISQLVDTDTTTT